MFIKLKNTLPGLILLDKPRNITSHQALAPLKSVLGSKIGHCGTLDPFATGLLIACSASLTKIVSYFQQLSKTYEAKILFGTETDTLDVDGTIIARAPVPTIATIKKEIMHMCGPQMQTPPQYSAIKVNGVRAYANAYSGIESALPPRAIHVHAFQLRRYEPPIATVCLTVSKGSYIRAIARDLAYRCNSVAYLLELRRTHIGDVSVVDAHAPDTFSVAHMIHAKDTSRYNRYCKVCTIPSTYAEQIRCGIDLNTIDLFRKGALQITDKECALLFDKEETLLAICAYQKKKFKYLCACTT